MARARLCPSVDQVLYEDISSSLVCMARHTVRSVEYGSTSDKAACSGLLFDLSIAK
jgi:hypothetical protein